MATPQTTPQGFTPFFQRISQGEDRHADVLACCAMLCNKSLADMFKQAETLGLPKFGPFYPYLDGDMIAKILVPHGLVATVWKEAAGYNDLPDVTIVMVDYSPEWEVGRCVVFHRQRSADGKSVHPYVVDPYQPLRQHHRDRQCVYHPSLGRSQRKRATFSRFCRKFRGHQCSGEC